MEQLIYEQQIQPQIKEKDNKKIQIMSFEEEDQIQIQQINEDDNFQLPQVSSTISETEKHKRQIRAKVKEYIDYRRSLGLTAQNKIIGYGDEQQQLNGALIDELGCIQDLENFKRETQIFILTFNKSPDTAIQEYVKKGIIKQDTPDSIAQYLIKLQGLNKQALGQYFGKNNPKSLKVLHSFCNHLNFKNVQFDIALRQLLARFKLPGQSQQIQRIVWEFSLAYYEANTHKHDNADQLFPLSYAIIMLATDAHNPKQEKKMSKQQFVKNTQGPCPSIQKQYLSGIYDRITKQPFKTQVSYIETHPIISIPDVQSLLKLSNDLKKGDIFLKICWSIKKYVQRRIYLSQDQERIQWVSDPKKNQNQVPRFINIKDITDLTLGLGSEVMKKNNVPQQFDNLCFTITTIHRSLDLKAKTVKQRAKWVNYIRVILIRRRQRRVKQLQDNYKSNMSYQQIQQIWNTEIFPKWDDHWDYKKKKPKQKNVIVRSFQALCGCFSKDDRNNKNDQIQNPNNGKKLIIKSSILETLWGLGLPFNSRKVLWPLVIGNNLAITPTIIQQIKKRARYDDQIKKFTSFDEQVIELACLCRQFRPDIPAVRDLLKVSQIFWKVFPKMQQNNILNPLLNQLHQNHFLSFYRADKIEIDSRIKLFQYLLQINAPKIKEHFVGLKLETRMYLVSWFLSIFYDCFNEDQPFLLRIWDNFLLEGEIYLFKVGITIVKYYQVELNMCTFHEGLTILRFPKNTSSLLFFKILQQNIKVTEQDYAQYVQKRKNAVIKTRVQAIPLE